MRRLAVLTGLATLLAFGAFTRTIAGQMPRSERVNLPVDHAIGSIDRTAIALAPDGSRLVYVANGRLYLKSVGGDGAPAEIPGTSSQGGVSNPVFSPDGRSVAFWSGADRTLKRIALTGGAATTICEADNPFGMSWGPNDTLLVGQGSKGVARVSANGGAPETLIVVKDEESAYGPQLLSGGDAVLFTVIDSKTALNNGWDKAHIVVQPLRGSGRKTVIEAGRDGRYSSTGHLLYVVDEKLFAVKFDAKQRTTSGTPIMITDDVRTSGPTGAAQFAFAESGALVYLPDRSGEIKLALVSLDGTSKMLGAVPNATGSPRISADGKRAAFASDGSIWTADLSNLKGMKKIIPGSNYNFPVFSDDGKSLVFGTILPNGLETIYMQNSDGSGEMELLARPARAPEHWFPGTQMFSFITHKGRLDYDSWTFNVSNHEVTPLARIPVSAQLSSRLSPDGHWIAYMSNETGEFQVYVEPWPQTGARFQATKKGGILPLWSSDSADIYYVQDDRMYAVRFQNGINMFGEQRQLPISGFVQGALRRGFDQTPDGKQFLMLFRSAPRVATVSHWMETPQGTGRAAQ